jgi:hypothetical protein
MTLPDNPFEWLAFVIMACAIALLIGSIIRVL